MPWRPSIAPPPMIKRTVEDTAEADRRGIEWSYNPWRERPGAATVATAAALGLCIAVAQMKLSIVVTLGLSLAIVGALSPLIAPARCRLDDEGASRRGPLGWNQRPWKRIRSGKIARGGLLVTPYTTRHWLDSTRGLFLPLPAHTRVSLVARIRPRLAEHGL